MTASAKHPPHSRHRRNRPRTRQPLATPGLATVALPALALLILWLYARSVGGDDTGPVIAVLPSAQAVEDEYIGARNLMARALNSPGTLDVIPAERVKRLLAAHGVADDDDARIMQLLHDAMGVQYLLRTSIQQQGDQWTTHAVLIDREGRRTELAPEPGSMVAMVTGMGRQLSRTLGTRWRDQLSPSVMSHDDFANEAMARGLHACLWAMAPPGTVRIGPEPGSEPVGLATNWPGAAGHEPARTGPATAQGHPHAGRCHRSPAGRPRHHQPGIMDWRAGDMTGRIPLSQAVAIEEIGHNHGMASAGQSRHPGRKPRRAGRPTNCTARPDPLPPRPRPVGEAAVIPTPDPGQTP